jgi:hypothetical protein
MGCSLYEAKIFGGKNETPHVRGFRSGGQISRRDDSLTPITTELN